VPILNFNSSPHPRGSFKSLKWILGICATATVIALGTTFASQINLNSGGNVEFGQGQSASVSCQDSPLTITPSSTYSNSQGIFILSGLNIDGINTGCLSHWFKVAVWPLTGSAPLLNFSLYDFTGSWATGGPFTNLYMGGDTLNYAIAPVVSAVITTLSNGNIDSSGLNNIPASLVSKITIESSSTLPVLGNELQSLCQAGGNCSRGDIGPGGGTVFFVSSEGFSENGAACDTACHYLEAAPTTGNNSWDDTNGGYLFAWSPDKNIIGTYEGLGFGLLNTRAMKYANNKTGGFAGTDSLGYRGPHNLSDWFLPSQAELRELADRSASIPSLGLSTYATHRYWSSTEVGASLAVARGIHGNNAFQHDKYFLHYVRPIRAF